MSQGTVSIKQTMSLPNRVLVIQDYSALWQQFFTFFSDTLQEREFTPEEEQEFAKIVSVLALNHYKFQELTKSYFSDAGKVMDVLSDAVSLEHMATLPPASFSKIQVEWHSLFIGMHKALGRMLKEMSQKDIQKLQMLRQGSEQAA